MSDTQIGYGKHALQRRRKRGISRRDVRWLLARGTREPTVTHGGPQRWLSLGTIDSRRLGVVFVESATTIHVVTVLDFDR